MNSLYWNICSILITLWRCRYTSGLKNCSPYSTSRWFSFKHSSSFSLLKWCIAMNFALDCSYCWFEWASLFSTCWIVSISISSLFISFDIAAEKLLESKTLTDRFALAALPLLRLSSWVENSHVRQFSIFPPNWWTARMIRSFSNPISDRSWIIARLSSASQESWRMKNSELDVNSL